jgi:adenine-specific DNA-methyltransferase
LIARAKAKDATLGDELEREFKALASERAFGLNFERHRPESVELPGRSVRRGDKVRVLPKRGSTQRGGQRLWRVTWLDGEVAGDTRMAQVAPIDAETPETAEVAVADLVVVAEFRDFIYPHLVSTGRMKRGGGKPFHKVINGENFQSDNPSASSSSRITRRPPSELSCVPRNSGRTRGSKSTRSARCKPAPSG